MKLKIFSSKHARGYKGLSDFMINAPSDKQIQVFTEVTKRATDEQKKLLDKGGTILKNC